MEAEEGACAWRGSGKLGGEEKKGEGRPGCEGRCAEAEGGAAGGGGKGEVGKECETGDVGGAAGTVKESPTGLEGESTAPREAEEGKRGCGVGTGAEESVEGKGEKEERAEGGGRGTLRPSIPEPPPLPSTGEARESLPSASWSGSFLLMRFFSLSRLVSLPLSLGTPDNPSALALSGGDEADEASASGHSTMGSRVEGWEEEVDELAEEERVRRWMLGRGFATEPGGARGEVAV